MRDVPDNSIVENQALNVLRPVIQKCHKLKTNIPENDKTISWDGDVEVYSKTKFTKKSLLGTVSVQVKGHWVKRLPQKKSISFYVDIEDLKNYYASNGVIFFVVHCNDDGGVVYYKLLLPIDLYTLLKDISKSTGKIKIDLDALPTDSLEVYGLFRDFIYHSKKQGQLDTKAVDKFHETGIRELGKSFSFGYGGLSAGNRKELINYMLKHPTYVYAKAQDYDIDVPLGKVNFAEIGTSQKCEIVVGDEILYDEAVRLYSADGNVRLKIGNNIFISETEHTVTFNHSLKMSERIKDLKFILDLANKENITDENIEIVHIKDDVGVSIKELRNILAFYQDLQKALEKCGCRKDVLFTNCDEKDLHKMRALIDCMIYDRAISYSFNGEPGVGTFNFANISLLVICEKKDENYILSNPFDSKEFVARYTVEETNGFIVGSPYLALLRTDRLIKVDNINYEEIKNSILRFNDGSEIYSGEMTRYILEVLNAYDISPRKELLNLAESLQDALNNAEEDSPVHIINSLQIKKRKMGKLDKGEKNELLTVKKSNSGNSLMVLCCDILLESNEEAELIYDSLSEQEKETFETFPVKKLWTKER